MEFVDSNVVLYAYDATARARHRAAGDLMSRLGRTKQGVLSVQVLQEFYVNAVTKIVVPLTPSVGRERLRTLSRWPVHSPLHHDVIAASVIGEDHQISFWDAMIVRSAAEMGCDVLWTEDLNEGQIINGVRIANPFAEVPKGHT